MAKTQDTPAETQGANPETRFRVLHGAVSGLRNGKPHDFPLGAVVPADALSPVHDLDSLAEAGAIEPVRDGE